jgi:hypothetical protein
VQLAAYGMAVKLNMSVQLSMVMLVLIGSRQAPMYGMPFMRAVRVVPCNWRMPWSDRIVKSPKFFATLFTKPSI